MGDDANFFATKRSPAIGLIDDNAKTGRLSAVLERYWRAVRRHLLGAVAIMAAVLLAAVVFTLLATPKYTASARLEISRDAAKITNVEGLESERSNQDLEFYQTQYALLSARSIAEGVANRLNVVADDRFFNAMEIDVDQALQAETRGPNASLGKARLELAINTLLANLQVRPVPGSRLVDVAYISPSAALSAEVANLWVEQFQQSAVARRFGSTSEARDFLEKQLEDMRAKLEESQRRLVNYGAANEIIILATNQDENGNTDSSETLRTSDLRALNEALSNATAQRIAAQSQAAQSNSSSQLALSNIALNNLYERRATAAAQLARQRAIFEPAYPVVQSLQAEVDDLSRSIAVEEGRIRRSIGATYREALDREQALRAQVEQLKNATIQEQRASIQYAIYQREVDTNRELYEGLLQRYKEIGVAGVGANNIAIVDLAVLPKEPTSPNLALNLLLGLLAGTALAGGYVFVREEIDQSIKDPAQVTELFDLPLLGSIPQQNSSDIDEELQDVKSPLSEAYFSTASNLSFLTTRGAPRSLALTSTRPNEGKSTSAYALAVAMARTGKRTLLIDCDIRNPSQHEYFGVAKVPGLSNVLTSKEQAPHTLAVETETPNLYFMPAGRDVPNPGALLISDTLRDVVEQLTKSFDHVIVDGPPMLGLADAPLIAKSVEGLIFVIEANGVRTRAIETTLNRLRFSGANLFGAIVTKLNNSNSAYGYGYGYGYGYSYGDKADG